VLHPANGYRPPGGCCRTRARNSYLTGLFASVGWLALLAPEYLLLGLPLLVANVFSNFPGQFSGEQHYSAPLASSFVLAAIYGGERLMRLAERLIRARWIAERSRSTLVASLIGTWAVAFALGQQVDRGWTPLARYFTWPERTGHHLLLERFLTQIPPDAVVSASPAVHPHLAHRHKIYVYPVIEDAEFILVDVTGVTDMHPLDLKERLEGAVAQQGFGILDAADGYVLLQRGAGGWTWPEEFVSFARVTEPQPAYPGSATFGDGLELIGYDVIDEPRWRLTRLRFYLRVRSPLSPGTLIRYEARTPAGRVVDSSELRPPPALLWYQAERWRPGQTIALETIPWFLPRTFAPVLAVTVDGTPVPPRAHQEPGAGRAAEVRGQALLLPAWTRARGILTPTDGVTGTVTAGQVTFGGEGWSVQLAQHSIGSPVSPGANLPVALDWRAGRSAPRDYSVFLHLRDAAGATVAQADGQPSWFLPRPATGWSGRADEAVWDARELGIPEGLAPGTYRLILGWYDWQTGDRLDITGKAGNLAGDEAVLGDVVVDPRAGPRVDVVCLMAPESCTSLP
jgi:hypothetical protein